MGRNFLGCDREQAMLLPPDLRDWLPEDHLAWFVLDAVAELDLDGFYSAYPSPDYPECSSSRHGAAPSIFSRCATFWPMPSPSRA